MCRNSHDCARTVAAEHIVSYPDWYFFASRWVQSIVASEYARFFFCVVEAFDFGFLNSLLDVLLDLFACAIGYELP